MADSCSSSSEEEHAILLGALAVLQQINEEEEKEKPEETEKIMVKWRTPDHCKLCLDGHIAISIFSRHCFVVNHPQRHSIILLHNYVKVMLTFQ